MKEALLIRPEYHDEFGAEAYIIEFVPDHFQELSDIIPEEWEGNYVPLFCEVQSEVCTHLLALVSRVECGGWFFFAGERITTEFMVISYDQRTEDYMLFHCEDCAGNVLEWISGNQETWAAPLGGLAKKGPSTHPRGQC